MHPHLHTPDVELTVIILVKRVFLLMSFKFREGALRTKMAAMERLRRKEITNVSVFLLMSFKIREGLEKKRWRRWRD